MEQLLFLITSLFTMINPLGSVPLYIALTDQFSQKDSIKVAIKASITAFVALCLFAFLGEWVFSFFGISVDGLRAAGGILFFLMGYEMLRGKTVPKRLEGETNEEYGSDVAISPLGIPMVAGPGGITLVILFFQDASSLTGKIYLVASVAVVCTLTAVIFIYGRRLMSAMGPSGSRVLMRIMGLIVMLIAVEFFFTGITPYVREMLMIDN